MTPERSRNAIMWMLLLILLLSGPAWAYSDTPGTPAAAYALQHAHWVAEGATRPRHILYVFVDANCPYCHALWRALQPYQRAGLQVRNILVGVISASSPSKAAAVFDARDPAIAWRRNEEHWGSLPDGAGGIEPITRVSATDRTALADNLALMHGFGIPGTPGLVYIDARHQIHVIAGVPGKIDLAGIVHHAAVLRH